MEVPTSTLSNHLEVAAAALTGMAAAPEAVNVLRLLRYDDGNAAAAAGRGRLLRAAASFRRLFQLPVPDAPGLVFFGAEADPATMGLHNSGLAAGSFAGSGLHPRQAFQSCVGEGIEYLSQFPHPDDHYESGLVATFGQNLDTATRSFIEQVLAACQVPRSRVLDWTPVRRVIDGATCWYPSDLALRRPVPDFIPPLKLSSGCAAGETPQAAALAAMLELIERDAAALWWRGGRRGRAIAPDGPAGQATASLLAQARQTRDDRQTALLDITTDLGVPVVAAFSTHRRNGYDFAVGLGARTTLAEAARSAVFEMFQSELSLHVIAAKQREAGERALNQSDLRQLARARALDPKVCALLCPADETLEPQLPQPLAGEPSATDQLRAVSEVLARNGIVAYSLDLTRPCFEVPVVRIIAPGLQLDPCKIHTGRLERTIAQTGENARHSGGIALL